MTQERGKTEKIQGEEGRTGEITVMRKLDVKAGGWMLKEGRK